MTRYQYLEVQIAENNSNIARVLNKLGKFGYAAISYRKNMSFIYLLQKEFNDKQETPTLITIDGRPIEYLQYAAENTWLVHDASGWVEPIPENELFQILQQG